MNATPTQIAQSNLILGNLPGVSAWPPDWQEREGGVEWFARRGAVLCRDADVDRVGRALGRAVGDDFPGRGQEQGDLEGRGPGRGRRGVVPTGSGASLLRWGDEGNDFGRDALEVLEELRRDPESADAEVRLDHLMYVCAHSCAAIEARTVEAGETPVPRLRTEKDAGGRGEGVVVRLFDTGVVEALAEPDLDWIRAHPWMEGVEGDAEISFVTGKAPQLAQDAGHGTFAAGSLRTVAPEADVYVVNAVAALPSIDGTEMLGAAFESDLAALIRLELLGRPGRGGPRRPVPDVLALNFAGRTLDDVPPLALATLWENLLQHLGEVLVMAPAGNDGDDRKNWPAAFDWAVSVGGLAQDLQDRAPWSCHGRTVDVFAPGDELVNAFATGEYTYRWETDQGTRVKYDGMARWSGTSFAMPVVAGLVAARMSETGQTSRRAWHDLQAVADSQFRPSTGAVLLPDA